MIVLYHKCGVYMEPNRECTVYLCIGCGALVDIKDAMEEITGAKDLLAMVREVVK